MKTLPLTLVAASCFIAGFLVRGQLTGDTTRKAIGSPAPAITEPKSARTIELSESGSSSEALNILEPDSSKDQTVLIQVDEDLGGLFDGSASHEALTLQQREGFNSRMDASTESSFDLLRK